MENRLEEKQSVLGDLSIRLLSYAQMKGKTIARIGDFTRVLGISKNQERNLLSRLAQSGFIIRLRRGVYLLPEKIPSGGSYNPGTAYILEKLFEDLDFVIPVEPTAGRQKPIYNLYLDLPIIRVLILRNRFILYLQWQSNWNHYHNEK